MSTSVSRSHENPSSSKLTAVIGASAPHLTLFTVCLLLLLYGYEIFNFSLSIDEEAYLPDHSLRGWIEQGRWAIGFLAYVFPPLGSVPVLSTGIFCAGLGVSACILARVLFRSNTAQWTFAGLFVSSPLWPHIAEFNPLSWGVGIGCVLATLSLLFILARPRFGDIWAAGLLALMIGIYQSFFVWFIVLLCILYLSVLLRTAPAEVTARLHRFPWLRSTLISVGGLLSYLAVQKILVAAFSLRPTYVQQWVRLADFTTVPLRAFGRILKRSFYLLAGADPIFLGYGYVLALLPLVGLLIVAGQVLWRGSLSRSQRLQVGASLVAALVFALSPLLMSAGMLPARALIPWIPLGAFLAAITVVHKGPFEKPLKVALAATLFISIWISVSLFYTDHLVRQRDQMLATRIMVRVDQILPNPPPARVPFVVVGLLPATDVGVFHKVEIFGDSFFEHDGGDPWRVAAYLRTLGIDSLEPHPLTDANSYRPAIEAMPVWPAVGSVAIVGNLLVIKLGPLPRA
jgi:hypothetical protein